MTNIEDVSREKLGRAFELIRSDIAYLHRDLALGEANRMRWIFMIMWLVLANLINDAIHPGVLYSLGISAVLIYVYRLFDKWRIIHRAMESRKVPLEPMFDTKVDLS